MPERWRRLAVAGSIGAILLCLALIVAPYLYAAGSLAAARWRWARRGSSSYTMVVRQLCNCAAGQYRLTVRRGQLIEVETVGDRGRLTSRGPNPAGFESMTVEATFDQAARGLRANWLPLSGHHFRVQFDPALGYITRLESGQENAAYFSYVYVVDELRLDSP